ncbi:MAG TPA: sugar ABC transporter permease, partial [Bacilli bacterium]
MLQAAENHRKKAKHNRTEFWMLFPSMIVLAAISIFPFIFMIYASFMNYTFGINEPQFVGFRNWTNIFTDATFWHSWGRTAIYAGAGLILQLVMGVAMALLLYHIPKARNFFATMWMLPLFVAPIVTGLLWRFLLDPTYGLYYWLLHLIGMKA